MPDRVMTVGDLMTREVVTLYEEENLAGLLDGMERFRFRHLPVVDGETLVGLVTHRDLLRAGVSPLEPHADQRAARLAEQTFVRDVMQTDVETTAAHVPLVEAAKRMRDSKRGCLPVVGDDGELVGILTSSDLLTLAIRFLGGQ
ncbi:MAG TPA: CBS domain-containing protein [Sandaracinaceae bacterium LLY-WYZ-13_1]|nr:CBS domain-containing protein [Sandaracinaceae bacterium LLY-WYZ-13_1]